MESKHKELLQTRADLLRQLEDLQADLTLKHLREQEALASEHQSVRDELEQQHTETKVQLAQHIAEIEKRYNALRKRFENREPRVEDVKAIRELRSQVDAVTRQRNQV